MKESLQFFSELVQKSASKMAQKAVSNYPTPSPCSSPLHPVLWSRALSEQSLEHDTRWMLNGAQPPRMSKQGPLTYTHVTCLFQTVNSSISNNSVKLTFRHSRDYFQTLSRGFTL